MHTPSVQTAVAIDSTPMPYSRHTLVLPYHRYGEFVVFLTRPVTEFEYQPGRGTNLGSAMPGEEVSHPATRSTKYRGGSILVDGYAVLCPSLRSCGVAARRAC